MGSLPDIGLLWVTWSLGRGLSKGKGGSSN